MSRSAFSLIIALLAATPARAQDSIAPSPLESPTEVPSAAADTIVRGAPPEFFEQLWAQRRQALEKSDYASADAMLVTMVDAKQLAGWPNLVTYGLAVAREGLVMRHTGESARALALAEAAVKLAPYRPETWAAKAHVSTTMDALASVLKATSVIITNPIEMRLRLGNLALACVVALLVASFVFGVITLYRHQGQLIYGILQLLPTGATRVQAALIVIAAVATPLLVGVGPIWTILIWVTLPIAFYESHERIAACVVIGFLAMLPVTLPRVVDYLGYTGSRAQDLYLAATDMGARDAAARVLAQSEPTATELLALGLRERYAGHIGQATLWIEKAIDKGVHHPSVFTILGNLHFFAGDRAGAIKAYERAISIDPKHVPALFNISRIYFSQAEHQRAGEAHAQAALADYDAVEVFDHEAKLHGLTYMAPDEVPLRVFATRSPSAPAVAIAAHDVWRELSGRTQPLWYMVVAGVIGVLVALAGIVVKPSLGVATRPAKGAGKGMASVEPLQRIRHEIEVHRHNVRLLRMRRVVALLSAGAGQLMVGRALAGFAFLVVFITSILMLLVALDVVPSPVPLSAGPLSLALLVYAGIAAVVYLVSLLDALREEH